MALTDASRDVDVSKLDETWQAIGSNLEPSAAIPSGRKNFDARHFTLEQASADSAALYAAACYAYGSCHSPAGQKRGLEPAYGDLLRVFLQHSHLGFHQPRDSHIDTGSSRTMSGFLSGDTISVDLRVHHELEEQESSLLGLGAALAQCETELRANIDLVTALESALNDSERNLRKVRIQMTDMAKERDRYANQYAGLRTQMQSARTEAENAKLELERHEQEARSRVEAQKRARKEAQANAEQRMLEMQRLNRKNVQCKSDEGWGQDRADNVFSLLDSACNTQARK